MSTYDNIKDMMLKLTTVDEFDRNEVLNAVIGYGNRCEEDAINGLEEDQLIEMLDAKDYQHPAGDRIDEWLARRKLLPGLSLETEREIEALARDLD